MPGKNKIISVEKVYSIGPRLESNLNDEPVFFVKIKQTDRWDNYFK